MRQRVKTFCSEREFLRIWLSLKFLSVRTYVYACLKIFHSFQLIKSQSPSANPCRANRVLKTYHVSHLASLANHQTCIKQNVRKGNFPDVLLHVFLCSVRWNKIPSAENLGNFELLIDEELASQTQDDNLLNNLTGKQRVNNRWK